MKFHHRATLRLFVHGTERREEYADLLPSACVGRHTDFDASRNGTELIAHQLVRFFYERGKMHRRIQKWIFGAIFVTAITGICWLLLM